MGLPEWSKERAAAKALAGSGGKQGQGTQTEGGTGSKGTGEIPEQPSAKGLTGKDFEDYLHEVIGGESKYIKGSTAGRDFDGVVGNR